MSAEHRTCYVVVCDACRSELENHDEGFIPHFDTPDLAHDYALHEGWHLDLDGRTYCPRCITITICLTDGHDYSPWMPCYCRGRIPAHDINGCGLSRTCRRDGCGHLDTSDLAHLPTTDEPHPFAG